MFKKLSRIGVIDRVSVVFVSVANWRTEINEKKEKKMLGTYLMKSTSQLNNVFVSKNSEQNRSTLCIIKVS